MSRKLVIHMHKSVIWTFLKYGLAMAHVPQVFAGSCAVWVHVLVLGEQGGVLHHKHGTLQDVDTGEGKHTKLLEQRAAAGVPIHSKHGTDSSLL